MKPIGVGWANATCWSTCPPLASFRALSRPPAGTSTSRRSRARVSRRRSWTSASRMPWRRRNRRSTTRSCASWYSTCRVPPRVTWTTRRCGRSKPARCTSSSTRVVRRRSGWKARVLPRAAAGRRSPRPCGNFWSTGHSTPISTAPNSCGSASSTWGTPAKRKAADAAPAPSPRELPPARRYGARVRPRNHGHCRPERLRQDHHSRGDRVRDAVAAEVRGLEAGLPDDAALVAERRAAEQRLAATRAAAQGADAARKAAEEGLKREEPRWNEWVARRERTLSLDGERRMAEQGVVAARQEFQRLDRELADALGAREQLRRLDAELGPVARLKQEVAELERLQRAAAARQADEAQLAELGRAAGLLERRLAELRDVAAELQRADATAQQLAEWLQAAERAAEEERTAWVQDRQYAETKRTELLKLYEEVKEQRDQIVKLGPQGTCPTCKRPLGPEYAAVLSLLDSQLEVITGDGKYFRQRLEQLAQRPPKLVEAETARDRVLEESRRASARAGELRAQLEEGERARAQLTVARGRAAVLERQPGGRPAGYDAVRHDAVRAELAKLEPIALEAAALEERARRAESLVQEAERAEQQLSAGERRVRELTDAVRGGGV